MSYTSSARTISSESSIAVDVKFSPKRVLKVIPMDTGTGNNRSKPQNFDDAKRCPKNYIPCPRNCRLFILKQRKEKHVYNECTKLYEEEDDDDKESLETIKIKGMKIQKPLDKGKNKKEAFVYGYTNQNKKAVVE